MKTKQYFFASANTGDGFISFLDKLNSPSKSSFTYIIKGGPGTGKSTMMKKIAQKFYDMGFSVEKFYCSTDPKSLDAVRIAEKNIAVVDGTAPHIVEPNVVGLTHKIVDTGQFINTNIFQDKDAVLKLTNQKKLCFDLLYKNLSIAKKLDDVNFEIAKQNLDVGLCQKKAKHLFSKIKNLNPTGENRTLFLSAINDFNANLEMKNKYQTVAYSASRYEGFVVQGLLENLLVENNISYVKILDVLNPAYTDSIIINNHYLIKNIDLNKKTNKKIENNNKLIKKIINFSKKYIYDAKMLHKQIEKYYIQNVDFEGIEKLTEELIEEIKAR